MLGVARDAWRELTSGQRWTALLAVALGIALLAFGLPDRVTVAGLGGRPSRPASAAAGEPAPGTTIAQRPPAPGGPSIAGGLASPEVSGGAVRSDLDAPPDRSPLRGLPVAVLVQPPGLLETRTDEAIVRRLLALSGVDQATVVAASVDNCGAAAGNQLVLAATDLPADLRTCLAAAGALVLAHDALGHEPAPDGAGLTTVVSTRRGVAASLLESAPVMTGRVGILAEGRLRSGIEAALPELAGRGVAVVATGYLDDSGADLGLDEALAFQGAAVETVVFATSVQSQSSFGVLMAALRPGVRFVVADAADSVVNELYPPAFEGAVAVTPLVHPWGERAGASDPARSRCIDRWERAQLPPRVLDEEERIRVLAWCQLLDIAGGVADHVVAGGSATDLLGQTWPSLLTSALGPLESDAVWGPQTSVTLRWAATCRCWEPQP